MTSPGERVEFASPDLLGVLESGTVPCDDLPFGLVVMDRSGNVLGYNAVEAELSGLNQANVIGRNFFEEVGPCTNNFLVAQRFVESDALDETIDYVFTFRMAPTPVRLRMMAAAGSGRQYLAVVQR